MKPSAYTKRWFLPCRLCFEKLCIPKSLNQGTMNLHFVIYIWYMPEKQSHNNSNVWQWVVIGAGCF